MNLTLAFLICALPFLAAVLSQTNTTDSTMTAKNPSIFSKNKEKAKQKPTNFVGSKGHRNTSTFVKPTSVSSVKTKTRPLVIIIYQPSILQPTCTGQLSCVGRCAYRLDFERIPSELTGPSCFCDPLCDSVFQDCCADYDQECNATWMKETFPKSDLDTQWECAKPYGMSDEIWMVASCSPNWAKDEVSKKCTNYEDFPGISVLIPVISNNVTFRNRYCALCNNVDVFTPWKYDVDCDVIPPGDYTELESVAFMDSFCGTGSLSFPSDQMLFIRYCYEKKTKCFYEDDKASVEGCQTGPTGLVAVFAGYNFRNLDCLRCSFHVKGNWIPMCGPQIVPITTHITFSPSFSSIFKSSELRSSTRRSQCPDGDIFDKVSRVCKQPLGKQDLSGQNPFQRYFISMEYEEENNSCLVSFLYAGPETNRLRFSFVFEELLRISLIESGWRITDLDVQTEGNSNYFVTFQVFGKLSAGETYLGTPLQYSKIDNIVFHSKLLLRGHNGTCSYSIANTTVRAMLCAENNTYPARNEDDFSDNRPIFINETHQFYYPGQYFVYREHNETRLVVCKDFKPANCSGYIDVKNKTLWGTFPNRSIYSNVTESLFDYGEYSIVDGTLWLCLTKDHLGNTIEIWPADLWPSQLHRNILSYATMVTFVISIISLVVLLVVYSVFPSLRNLPGKNLMLLCGVLAFGQLLWLLESAIHSLSQVACVVTLQYLLFAQFCCSTSIAFHSFLTFDAIAKGKLRQSSGSAKTFIWYALFSLGFPLGLVTLFWLLHHFEVVSLAYVGERCWFADLRSMYIAFIAPVYTILLINLLFLLATLRLIHKCTKESQKVIEKNGGPSKKHIGIYMRMSTLTGVTWLFGIFLFTFPKVLAFDYLFVIINGLQGFYIAVAFLFTDNVKKNFSRKLFRSDTTSKTLSTSGAKSIC